MRRKFLLSVAALSLPLASIALLTATAGPASAKTPVPPDPPANCNVAAGAFVTFAAPGLSNPGSEGTSKTSTTTTNTVSFSNCTGSVGGQTITTKNVKCKGADNPTSNPACTVKGDYGYGSTANFITSGGSSITKSLKKLSFTVNGVTYGTKTTNAAEFVGAPCNVATSEVGFSIQGAVKTPKQDKGQTTAFTVCLGADTGPGTTGSFGADFGANGITIATTEIDPAYSVVTVS